MPLLTQFASFFISSFSEKSVTDELNAFLRSHRIRCQSPFIWKIRLFHLKGDWHLLKTFFHGTRNKTGIFIIRFLYYSNTLFHIFLIITYFNVFIIITDFWTISNACVLGDFPRDSRRLLGVRPRFPFGAPLRGIR